MTKSKSEPEPVNKGEGENEASELKEAFQVLENHSDIAFSVDPQTAVVLLGSLQLVLRHPHMVPGVAKSVTAIARLIEKHLVRMSPKLAPFLERGWDSSFDVNEHGVIPTKKASFSDLDGNRQWHILTQDCLIHLLVTEIVGDDVCCKVSLLDRFLDIALTHLQEEGDLLNAKKIAELDEICNGLNGEK